jgi:hypothetical protein
MKESQSKNIFQRLNAVMAEVDYIQKDQKKVAGQYRFVSHDSVTAALHGPMTKHGIACVPNITGIKQDGNRTEIQLEVWFVNIDDPKDRFTVTYWGYGIDAGDKGIGKAVSYAFKYALLKTFCLETGDDPDQDQNVKHEPEKPVPEPEKVDNTPSSEVIMEFLGTFGKEQGEFSEYLEEMSNIKKWTIAKTTLMAFKNQENARNGFKEWQKKRSIQDFGT